MRGDSCDAFKLPRIQSFPFGSAVRRTQFQRGEESWRKYKARADSRTRSDPVSQRGRKEMISETVAEEEEEEELDSMLKIKYWRTALCA